MHREEETRTGVIEVISPSTEGILVVIAQLDGEDVNILALRSGGRRRTKRWWYRSSRQPFSFLLQNLASPPI